MNRVNSLSDFGHDDTSTINIVVVTTIIKSIIITEKIDYSIVVAGKQSNHVLEHGHKAETDDSICQFIRWYLADAQRIHTHITLAILYVNRN